MLSTAVSSGNRPSKLASLSSKVMTDIFMVKVADKFRDRTWVSYPKQFETESEAEDFAKQLRHVAPNWRFVKVCNLRSGKERILEPNDNVEAPPSGSAESKQKGETE